MEQIDIILCLSDTRGKEQNFIYGVFLPEMHTYPVFFKDVSETEDRNVTELFRMKGNKGGVTLGVTHEPVLRGRGIAVGTLQSSRQNWNVNCVTHT